MLPLFFEKCLIKVRNEPNYLVALCKVSIVFLMFLSKSLYPMKHIHLQHMSQRELLPFPLSSN